MMRSTVKNNGQNGNSKIETELIFVGLDSPKTSKLVGCKNGHKTFLAAYKKNLQPTRLPASLPAKTVKNGVFFAAYKAACKIAYKKSFCRLCRQIFTPLGSKTIMLFSFDGKTNINSMFQKNSTPLPYQKRPSQGGVLAVFSLQTAYKACKIACKKNGQNEDEKGTFCRHFVGSLQATCSLQVYLQKKLAGIPHLKSEEACRHILNQIKKGEE